MEPTRIVLGCESGFGFVGIRSRSSFGLRGKIAINIKSKRVMSRLVTGVQGRLVARLNTPFTQPWTPATSAFHSIGQAPPPPTSP